MIVPAPTPQSTGKTLNVLLVFDAGRVWRWQAWLAQAIQADGHNVAVQRTENRAPLPSSVRLLMTCEDLLFAGPADHASARLGGTELAALPAANADVPYDLAIDFTGQADPINADRVLRPFFILGEVNKPGQYPFVNAMTVEAAVAIAEGYTERAKKRFVRLTRRFGGVMSTVMVPADYPVQPGDTIYVLERFF